MHINEILDTLIELHSLNSIKLSKYSFTINELILALLELDSMHSVALALDIEEDRLESIVRRKLKPCFPNKDRNERWASHLLSTLDLRKCPKCNYIKHISGYYPDPTRYNGVTVYCCECEKIKNAQYRITNAENIVEYRKKHYIDNRAYYIHKNALRRAVLLKATPPWADLSKIKEIYRNCPEGWHVDHVIPLQGDLVCGLHVETNLKPVPAKENLAKGNKYTVD